MQSRGFQRLRLYRTALTHPHVQFRAMAASSSSSTPPRSTVPFDRVRFEAMLQSRFFYTPSFEIYGGTTGFYDYGPPGAALQANIIELWRKHFVVEEEMLELDTTIITVADVLKTSGHVDKFTDWMTKDVKTGDIFRADHLVEAVLEARLAGDREARGIAAVAPTAAEAEAAAKSKKKKVKSTAVRLDDHLVDEFENVLAQIDNYTGKDLGELMHRYAIKAPETGNDLTDPVEFNLMFDVSIGPTGAVRGYLRPETAQGHFINFQRLLEQNYGRVPFASAQIGKSFRNEISPRQGLLRVREFTMAEIEHYVDPRKKKHARFDEVRQTKLRLLPKDVQSAGRSDLVELPIGEAVDQGIVDNETLGYFLVRIHRFCMRIGIDPARLRFRQHMANEMAHYAADCWDAEIHSSYGWIECVGCADRSAYDLTVHSAKTGKSLAVEEMLEKPITTEVWRPEFRRKIFGPHFKKDAKLVEDTILAMDEPKLECMASELKNGKSTVAAADGRTFDVTSEMVTIDKVKETVHSRKFTPNVIEPSFGIGRILYSLLEHVYWVREPTEKEKKEKTEGRDPSQRHVLSFPPLAAPTKVLIVPLSANDLLRPIVRQISSRLRAAGVSCRVDDSSASIGKRYARNDEMGTPFGLTIDFDSPKKGTITLRERDTMAQLIGSIDEVCDAVINLSTGVIEWEHATQRLRPFEGQTGDAE